MTIDLAKKELRAWLRLGKVHARLTAAIDLRFKSEGQPPAAWFPILSELARCGPEGLRPFELEQATGEAQYNISRLLDRMTKAGLVARQACEDDRRGWRVALTESGGAAAARMRTIHDVALAEDFIAPLTGKQVKSLDSILGDLLRKERRK
jgi:DNA-binding MarR family transcriptional regulator